MLLASHPWSVMLARAVLGLGLGRGREKGPQTRRTTARSLDRAPPSGWYLSSSLRSNLSLRQARVAETGAPSPSSSSRSAGCECERTPRLTKTGQRTSASSGRTAPPPPSISRAFTHDQTWTVFASSRSPFALQRASLSLADRPPECSTAAAGAVGTCSLPQRSSDGGAERRAQCARIDVTR